MQPPCNPGTTACVGGAVVCQGFVGPQPNQCNGVSTDCTGMTNVNGNCPTGFTCHAGNCVEPCAPGEFPCQGGFACDITTNLCVPDGCEKLTCPDGFLCKLDASAMARCVDPCDSVNCPAGYRCKLGVCEDDTCKTFGCPTGQKCVGTPASCQPDPCFNVVCPANQFCNPQGDCVPVCDQTCMKGQICVNGMCVEDPCKGVNCISGQVCRVTNGVGMCVEDLCAGIGCNPGQVCCGGACVEDSCATIECPGGSECKVDSSCNQSCVALPAPPKDQVVGAGGGGFGCEVGGRGQPTYPVTAILLIGALFFRRRRRTR
jgi:hypothetical protein